MQRENPRLAKEAVDEWLRSPSILMPVGAILGFAIFGSLQQLNPLLFGGLGALFGLVAGVLWQRQWRKNMAAMKKDLRANKEAETQKQIDVMLRNASNIPKVSRK
ncbi:MAG: hypothetical protein GY952_16820 [Rhodobacteraceae bacterium]|nr:hypothetical protein [Paracoccaceae bacterium]